MKPILFNTEMVKAILEERKTVTRRVIKSEIGKNQEISKNPKGKFELYDISPRCGIPNGIFFKPPYRAGDVLYVRETWNYGYFDSSDIEHISSRYFEELRRTDGEFLKAISNYIYRADFSKSEEYEYGTENEKGERIKIPWHPSIHMPKEAARIFLKVTDVRVERLQDITVDDVHHEGVSIMRGFEGFTKLWDSTIKKENLHLYGWNSNPYVWVIEFKMCEKPESEG